MKKGLSLLLAVVMLLTLTACANTNQQGQENSPQPPEQETEKSPPVQPSEPEAGADDEANVNSGGVLVVYYSSTGSTEAVAGYIANELNGDTFAITPVNPYTSDDLNWRDPNSRISREHDDPSLRTMELVTATVENWDSYDTVFIGYPIWWGNAAWPVDNFITANDFTGKTVIPFCTSASSGFGESGKLLAELAGTGDWLEGQRFRSGVSEADVVAWVNGLNIN